MEKEQERIIKRAWNTAEVVIKCARIMRRPGDFDCAITDVLKELANSIQPERLYIVNNGDFGNTISYEWTNTGAASAREIFKELPPKVIRGFGEYVKKNPGVPLIMEDIGFLMEEEPDTYQEMSKRKLRNMISVSLYYDNQIFGNLTCDNFNNNQVYDIRELMETVAFFLSSEMANRNLMNRLELLSNTDLLTNVYNRNAYSAMVAELKRKKQPVGVIYADLNGLKKINDIYGHEAGDKAIKRMADILKEDFFRKEIYRIGGDEFVVIMPQIPEESFLNRKEQLINRLRTANDISVSVGTFWCESSENIELAIKEADVAMYRRKKRYYDGIAEQR